MSSIPQNHSDEKALIDCVQRFFSKHHVGKLLARCNGMKEKGVSPVSLFRYKLSNIFVGRSMYMQQQTGSFKEAFSKMDKERSEVCLHYARELELQLIVCVPDERLQSLIRNVDCVYGFRRHQNQVSMMHIDKGDYLDMVEGNE